MWGWLRATDAEFAGLVGFFFKSLYFRTAFVPKSASTNTEHGKSQ